MMGLDVRGVEVLSRQPPGPIATGHLVYRCWCKEFDNGMTSAGSVASSKLVSYNIIMKIYKILI